MKNVTLTLVILTFILAVGWAQSQTGSETPTANRHQSLEGANKRIKELEAENEALRIQQDNETLREMERKYDDAHPYWFHQPYYTPYPYYGGWGGFHYHHYPMYVHHHHHHHHH